MKNGASRATDGANGPIENDALVETIWRAYPALPFHALRFPTHPTQFFGTEDLVIEVNGNEWLTATTLTDVALERFLESVSDVFTPDAW